MWVGPSEDETLSYRGVFRSLLNRLCTDATLPMLGVKTGELTVDKIFLFCRASVFPSFTCVFDSDTGAYWDLTGKKTHLYQPLVLVLIPHATSEPSTESNCV